MKYKIIIFILLIYYLISANGGEYLFANDCNNNYMTSALTSYAYLLSQQPDWRQIQDYIQSDNIVKYWPDFNKINNMLKSINCDISKRMVINNYTFMFNTKVSGNIIGFNAISCNSNKLNKYDGILYLSQPTSCLNGNTVAILTTNSAERTTIFSFNNKFKANLIYDSNHYKYHINKHNKTIISPLGFIYKIKIIKPNNILLYESCTVCSNRPLPSKKGRIILLDISTKKIKVLQDYVFDVK